MTEIDIVQATGKSYGIDEALSIYTSKIDVKHSIILRARYNGHKANWAENPFHMIEHTKSVLMEYKKAVLIIGDQGKMDFKKFTKGLLDIEKNLRLNNYPKAFVLMNASGEFVNHIAGKKTFVRPTFDSMGIDIMSTIRRFDRNIDSKVKGLTYPAFGIVLLE